MTNSLFAQPWSLFKDKEGIKVYTRMEPSSTLKSFKGEATLQAPLDKISLLIFDPEMNDWWESNFLELKLLDYKKGKYVRYYMVYGLPWPIANRYMAAETRLSTDSVTGAQTMISKPLPNVVPEKTGLIRIDQYMQKWTLQPLDQQTTHVILEGFFDPGGNLPDWLVNMVLPETPFKTIQSLRKMLVTD